MTELSFLIELLLNHDLPKVTKDLVAQRIKEVELRLTAPVNPIQIQHHPQQVIVAPGHPQQSPSTLAAMARHGDIPAEAAPIVSAAPPLAPVVLSALEQKMREDSAKILKKRHVNI